MIPNNVTNKDGLITSLQVSKLKDIPAGDFNPGLYFLVKNITEDDITIQIRPAGQEEFITTILYSGWNPEIIGEIKNVSAGTLQYGY